MKNCSLFLRAYKGRFIVFKSLWVHSPRLAANLSYWRTPDWSPGLPLGEPGKPVSACGQDQRRYLETQLDSVSSTESRLRREDDTQLLAEGCSLSGRPNKGRKQ
jgi:hypothetical protein